MTEVSSKSDLASRQICHKNCTFYVLVPTVLWFYMMVSCFISCGYSFLFYWRIYYILCISIYYTTCSRYVWTCFRVWDRASNWRTFSMYYISSHIKACVTDHKTQKLCPKDHNNIIRTLGGRPDLFLSQTEEVSLYLLIAQYKNIQ